MQLLRMECVYDPDTVENPFWPGKVNEEARFIKLDNSDERAEYDEVLFSMGKDNYRGGVWDGYMSGKLGGDITDEDICYYIMEDEPNLDIGEIYEGMGGVMWRRIG